MLLVTGAVSVIPLAVVWALRSTGAVPSIWLALMVAGLLSLAISGLVRAYWIRRPHRTDLLFAELLPLGWLARWRTERKLADGLRLLQAVGAGEVSVSALPTRRSARLLRQLADALEAQDMYLAGHSRRVARHATMLGRRMGLSRTELTRLRAAAAIHDVGKLHIPPEILAKPTRLTPEEFALIKRHSEDGASIVSCLGDANLTAIVKHHHERIDGRGYPSGLVGSDIPLGARIVAVADTFDAITSARPYRSAASHQAAIKELRSCSGTQLDPDAVQTFLRCYAGRRQAILLGALMALPQRLLGRLLGTGAPTSSVWAGNLATVAATSFLGVVAVLPTVGSSLGPATADARSAPGLSGGPPGFAPPAGDLGRRQTSPRGDRHRSAAGRRRAGRHRRHRVRRHVTHRRARIVRGAGGGAFGNHRSRVSPSNGSPSPHRDVSGGRRPLSGGDRSHRHDGWIPPGLSGIGPPGRSPDGPPGHRCAHHGHGRGGPPGLRGETPPGHD